MKKKTVEDVLKEITQDSRVLEATDRLPEEEKVKLDGMLRNFVENFIIPLQELVDKASEDPQVKEQIREIMRSQNQPKKEAKDDGK